MTFLEFDVCQNMANVHKVSNCEQQEKRAPWLVTLVSFSTWQLQRKVSKRKIVVRKELHSCLF